jgi:uncharacterized SAM-binding protein YcdF (DUF218 family)
MKIFVKIALFLASAIALHVLVITVDGLRDELAVADCIVVLGNKAYGDSLLSPRLQGRVDRALELYRKGFGRKIFVSGAIEPDSVGIEGTAMANYLLRKGVPAKDIVVDNSGVNTHMTAVNYRQYATAQGYDTVLVVTQFYHITRSRMALRSQGIEHVYSAHAHYFERNDLFATLREVPAFYKYLFL